MRYTVEFDTQCYAELDEIAALGLGYDRLMELVRQIVSELSVDPLTKGAPLSEGLRKLDVSLLRVYYHVDEANEVVVIDGIRWR